ncbi:MAG: hypothetical protein KAT70_03350 [Thermoplasmata archaeon]|nr:hypothetical protein [Thermoplasmata archaeon]
MSETPPDMRNVVDSNRSLLKKIELAIPGFRGYRKKEDLRIADNLLRLYLADRLAHAAEVVGEAKRALSKRLELDLVKSVGDVEESINVLDKRLRHAEQGYSGLTPDYRVGEAELNMLYSYDNQMLLQIHEIEKATRSLQSRPSEGADEELARDMDNILGWTKQLSSVLDNRRNALIATVGVRK